MNRKRISAICFAVFLICVILLIVLTLADANSKDIIGGSGWPTVQFCFRQLMRSWKGILLAGIGAGSLICGIAAARKREQG